MEGYAWAKYFSNQTSLEKHTSDAHGEVEHSSHILEANDNLIDDGIDQGGSDFHNTEIGEIENLDYFPEDIEKPEEASALDSCHQGGDKENVSDTDGNIYLISREKENLKEQILSFSLFDSDVSSMSFDLYWCT